VQIYIHKNGKQLGPYPIEHVKAWLASGHLQPNDTAWYEGALDWMPLASIPGISQQQSNTESALLMAHGVNGQVTLFNNKIRIDRKGVLSFLTQGLKGEKEIFLTSITSIQFKQPGAFTNGYIQFGILGGVENRGGLFDATKDENTVMFNAAHLSEFSTLQKTVEQMIHQRANASNTPMRALSSLDELEKLASLRDKGIITEEEFMAKKKQLLNI
jgi:hypothetical protein